MGWWIGTVIFAGIYCMSAAGVHFTGKKGDNELKHLMVATSVFCCWYMWVIMYWAQLYPIPHPVFKEVEEAHS